MWPAKSPAEEPGSPAWHVNTMEPARPYLGASRSVPTRRRFRLPAAPRRHRRAGGLMCRTSYGVADLELDRGDPIGLVHRILALWSETAHAHRRRANESHCATAVILVILLRTRETVLA